MGPRGFLKLRGVVAGTSGESLPRPLSASERGVPCGDSEKNERIPPHFARASLHGFVRRGRPCQSDSTVDSSACRITSWVASSERSGG